MAQFDKGARQFRMALQRHRYAEDGQRQAALLELAQQAPDASARAVFIDALHAHVAVGVGRGADDLGEELLGGGVAVQHAVFAAFFVVEDELQRNARAARPAGVRRPGTVSDEIAWIVIFGHVSLLASGKLPAPPRRLQAPTITQCTCQSCRRRCRILRYRCFGYSVPCELAAALRMASSRDWMPL
ncbi:hypothetical protein D9M72_555980 [compost metagenome]